jgi:hypothetical protein
LYAAVALTHLISGPEQTLWNIAKRLHGWGRVQQDLKRFPEKGWTLLRVGLQSPMTRNRNMALNALREWPRTVWPDDAEWLLRKAYQAEPNGDLRERFKKFLQL